LPYERRESASKSCRIGPGLDRWSVRGTTTSIKRRMWAYRQGWPMGRAISKRARVRTSQMSRLAGAKPLMSGASERQCRAARPHSNYNRRAVLRNRCFSRYVQRNDFDVVAGSGHNSQSITAVRGLCRGGNQGPAGLSATDSRPAWMVMRILFDAWEPPTYPDEEILASTLGEGIHCNAFRHRRSDNSNSIA